MAANGNTQSGLHQQLLQQLDTLETSPDDRFDRITRLAAIAFAVPVAVMVLFEGQRHDVKSVVGLEKRALARDPTFWSHAATSNAAFVINDLTRDPRFATSVLVTEAPHFRFNAGCPIRIPNGRIVGHVCILDSRAHTFDRAAHDLLRMFGEWAEDELNTMELVQSALALCDTGMRLQAILNAMRDALIISNTEGRIEQCNRASAVLFGYSVAELVGSNVRQLMLEPYYSDAEGFQRYLRESSKRPRQDEEGRHRDGSMVPVDRRVSRLLLRDGEHIVQVIRDISERKELDRLKSDFLAAAAHELRSPIASIYGFAELLLQRRLEGPKQQELLRIIHDQSAQMTRLVNELLDLARIEARAGRDFSIDVHPLQSIVENAIAGFFIPKDRSAVEVTLPANLPNVRLDSDKTQQVVSNVLSNAYKYSKSGPVALIASFEPGSQFVKLRVRDHGIGMTPAVVSKIFERFFRANDSSQVRGTGLGMTLVKEIMEAQHGSVKVESEYGRWTEVTLSLPVATP